MKIAPNTLNVIVVGDWNKYYIDPFWFAKNVFKTDQFEIELNGQGIVYNVSVKHDCLKAILSTERITFILSDINDNCFNLLDNVLNNLFLNVQSPNITAYGYNIRFFENNTFSFAECIDGLSINNMLIIAGAVIKQTSIIHKLEYNEKTYNLNFDLSESKLTIDVNLHYDCNKPNEQIIIKSSIKSFYEETINLLKTCSYILESEEE